MAQSLHYPLMNSLFSKCDFTLFEYQVVLMHKSPGRGRRQNSFCHECSEPHKWLSGVPQFNKVFSQCPLGSLEHSFGNENVFLPSPAAVP